VVSEGQPSALVRGWVALAESVGCLYESERHVARGGFRDFVTMRTDRKDTADTPVADGRACRATTSTGIVGAGSKLSRRPCCSAIRVPSGFPWQAESYGGGAQKSAGFEHR
jgi:hypothetical protein